MKGHDKNFQLYEETYKNLPFEFHQSELRRRAILKEISSRNTRSMVEVGCGMKPIFVDFKNYESMHIVEPGKEFAENAQLLANKDSNVHKIKIVNALLEDNKELYDQGTLVLLSGLLHEVPDANQFMRAAARIGEPECSFLIIVPNSNSFHRQLAMRLGIISELEQISSQQRTLQQHRTFSKLSLTHLLETEGFEIEKIKSIIFKPFTHEQMQKLIDNSILSQQQVYGLTDMVDLLPDAGSELLVIAKKKG